jgi:hypothetical protein
VRMAPGTDAYTYCTYVSVGAARARERRRGSVGARPSSLPLQLDSGWMSSYVGDRIY